ncbi:MAG: hypothetical protein H5U02_00355 [Clostridia bacterium]|nr:hypothetical protein [Clostridia bacterium]
MELWERQKGESRKAYQAFCAYRDMGPARSLAKVSQQLRKSKVLLQRWSVRWSWVARAEAWDDELDRRAREAQEQARLEMVDRHARAAVAFQQRVLERLAELDPSELSPGDLVKWFDVAVKVERLSRGEPTEIGKQEVTLPPILEVVLDEEEKGADQAASGADPGVEE